MSAGRLCYVALGSNVGDSLRHLSRAVRSLVGLEGVRVRRTSSLYLTSPQYVTDQPAFLNAMVELELSARRRQDLHGLLSDVKGIEGELGRTEGVRRGPRVIDLDLVAMSEGHERRTECAYPFEVPHANMHERDFVLVPMADLSPAWRHPLRRGNPSVAEMLSALTPSGGLPDTWPKQLIPASGGLHGRRQGRFWCRGEQTLVMGILNVTPDSFSDGGDHADVRQAVAAAQAMLDNGAHILDVGGQSTAPGTPEVPAEAEIERVVPVIQAIREQGVDATISVDTNKAAVAREAVLAGADWINDVSAGEHDPGMLPVAAELMAPIVLMHMRGTPATMNSLRDYDDVLGEVEEYLIKRRSLAEEAGIPSWNIILDPGVGFAKTMEHNLMILRHCGSMVTNLQPSPLLVSASRKKFLGTILDEPEPRKRTFGNAATAAAAVAGGADVVRYHDVREIAQTCRVSDHIYRRAAPRRP